MQAEALAREKVRVRDFLEERVTKRVPAVAFRILNDDQHARIDCRSKGVRQGLRRDPEQVHEVCVIGSTRSRGDGCDRIALLNRTIVASGTPGELAADRAPWMRTFGVGEDSALLRILKAA